MPNPDLQLGNAQAVVEWLALPVLQQTGLYTITVGTSDGIIASIPVYILPPSQEHILVVPLIGSAGATFQVYYVNFDLGTQTFDFYGEERPVVGIDHSLSHRDQVQVAITNPLATIDGKGWAQQPVISATTVEPGVYAIAPSNLSATGSFWLR
jgi:hypothetical protein